MRTIKNQDDAFLGLLKRRFGQSDTVDREYTPYWFNSMKPGAHFINMDKL